MSDRSTIPTDLADLDRRTAWGILRDRGWYDVQIAAAYGVSRARVGQVLGRRPQVQGRRDVNLYVQPDAYERARKVAADLGLLVQYGPRVGTGSVSALIEAIGDGRLLVRGPGRA